MSKFEVIEGGKTKQEGSNLRFLMARLKEGDTNLSQREYLTFAYHFAINGDNISARRFLKRMQSFYFSMEIYKDLYKALLAWSIRETVWNEAMMKEYQYFIVVKKSLTVFNDFEFPAKPEFLEFRKDFLRQTTVIT